MAPKMSVQTLLNRFLKEPPTEDERLERLQEAELPVVDSNLKPFLFVPRAHHSDRASGSAQEPRFRVETPCDVFVINAEDVVQSAGIVRVVSRSVIGLMIPCFLARGT